MPPLYKIVNFTHHITFCVHRNTWDGNIFGIKGLFWITVLKITRQDQVVPLLWDSGEGGYPHGHAMGSGVAGSTNSYAITKQQRETGLTWVLQWHLRACPHVIQTFQRPTFYEVIEFPSDATRHHTFNTGAFGGQSTSNHGTSN